MNTELFSLAHNTFPECFGGSNPYSFNDGHLGGTNVNGDAGTFYHPNVWSYLIEQYNIKSFVDIGCGFGYAIKFLKENFKGIEVIGVEGSPKVVQICLFPDLIKQHDYNTGPYAPSKVYDLGWSTEFVEHVEEQYSNNFIETFKKCRYAALSYGGIGQGGHHHVNENTQEYWVNKFEQAGFEFLQDETQKLKDLAAKDIEQLREFDNSPYIFHFFERGLFFKNKNLQ